MKNQRKYGVRFSGHGSSFMPEHPVCDKTLKEAKKEARDWEMIADTIGGLAEVVVKRTGYKVIRH